ncbi:RHS repeat-associated core domain-containing protein [Mixta tenebrionis]|uniref:RHS repeat-associated core domain-containing protein n=2 Tax=Mixta tenebrionis TaxID=2562439 RepID=UPI0036433FB1
MALLVTKHIDPVVGVDVHSVIIPPATAPVPVPHPHAGFVLDPREYLNAVKNMLGDMALDFIGDRVTELAEANPELTAQVMNTASGVMEQAAGVMENVTSNPLVATALALKEKKDALMNALGANIGAGGGGGIVEINGLMRTTAGTHTQHFPGLHFPLGATFAPNDINPSRDAESYMGSKTVLANNDPLSFAVLPALSCWMKGLSPGEHNSAHTQRHYPSLPTATVLPIPMGRPVLVGGPPILNMVALLKALWGAFRGSKLAKALADKLDLPSGFLRCTVLDAEPVNSTTGEVVVEQNDFTLPGRLPFNWDRYYNGHHTAAGSLGAAWQTLADCRLEVLRHGQLIGVVACFPERKTAFDHFPVLEGDEGEERDWQCSDRLQRRGDLLILQTRNGVSWHFPLPADWRQRLSALPDSDEAIRNGNWQPNEKNTLKLPLSSFHDRNDNAWCASRDAQGRIITFTERCGNTPGGRVLRFAYSESCSQAISDISLWVEGKKVRTLVGYRYDDRGDMVAVEDAAGVPYTFGYEEGHRMVRHTDRNGLSFYYSWQLHDDGVMRVTHAWGDEGLFDYRFEYHLQDRTTLITDSLGHTSRLECNVRGFPISRTNGAGETFSYRYDAGGHTVRETDPLGHSTEWRYDALGNEVAHIRADYTRITRSFNSEGLPLTVTDPQGGVWQQEFDDKGNLTVQQTPEGVITRYDYDAAGQLNKVIHPDGGVTQLEYDDYGFLHRLTDPLQRTLVFSHDTEGNLLSRQEDGDITRYRYDICGRLVNVQQPDGRTLDCNYDAEGNLVRYSDNNRLVTQFSYCGQGFLKSRTAPDGSTVRYHYDTEQQLIGVENQRGERWALRRDAAGRLTQEIDYQGGVRRYHYNPAGHLTQATDPLGNLLQVTCDRMGRIVSKTPQEGQEGGAERFSYDAFGRLTEAVNDTATVSRRYSADGWLTEEWQRQKDILSQHEYQWRNGRLVRQHQRVYGAGGHELLLNQEQQLDYDDAGRLSRLTPDDYTPLEFTWDGQHRLSELRCSDTFSQLFSYNRQGLLSRQRARVKGREAAVTEYGYDEHNQLVQRSDSLGGVDSYRYDPLGQITAHTDPTGQIRRYSYDATGNRFRVTAQHEKGRVLEHADGARWHMDNAGQLRLLSRGGHEQRLGWDAYGRLLALVSEKGRWRYGYDALGRRLYKQEYDPGGQQLLKTTWFSWDDDRLAGEVCHDRRQARTEEATQSHLTVPENEWTAQAYLYHPGTFEPLVMQLYQAEPEAEPLRRPGRLLLRKEVEKARLKTDTLCFYQNDPNGMPLRLWSSAGEVVWSARYSVTGRAQVSESSVVNQPLRLQGQYFDEESGLHYNRFRYYDPCAGMFISQDPIGLVGGINPYQYGPNVFDWFDPLGLWKKHRKNGQFAKKPGRKKKKCNSAHGNSHSTDKPAEGYTLRDRDTGEVAKYGETTMGTSRYSQKYLDDNNVDMFFEAEGTKKEMHTWQHDKILEYKSNNGGKRPPLNKSDY